MQRLTHTFKNVGHQSLHGVSQVEAAPASGKYSVTASLRHASSAALTSRSRWSGSAVSPRWPNLPILKPAWSNGGKPVKAQQARGDELDMPISKARHVSSGATACVSYGKLPITIRLFTLWASSRNTIICKSAQHHSPLASLEECTSTSRQGTRLSSRPSAPCEKILLSN